MSDLDLTIDGRSFKVACAPGEEGHVRELGRMIDQKVSGMGLSGQSEGRMFLFASLLLADEIHELRRNGAGHAPASVQDEGDPALAARLEAVADALEKCASHLEG